MNQTRLVKGVTVGLAMIALAACKGNDRYASTDSAKAANDSAAGRVVDTTHRADSVAAVTKGWTPGAILGYVAAANSSEIQEGKLVEKKATNPQVKTFGRQMVADHQAMQTETKGLAAKINATVDSTTDDVKDLWNHSRDEIKDLTEAKAGKDWDKNYIDKAIDDHQHVLDKLQDAAKNTTDADLRAALEKATGKVQQHLTKAQDIKAKLS